MSKSQKILGWINGVLSALWLALIVTNIRQLMELTKGPEVTAFDFAPTVIVIISTILNGYLAFMLLTNKKSLLSRPAYLLLTFSPVLWLGLLFVGSFFAASILFPLVSVALIGTIYFLVKKTSQRLAVAYCVVTTMILLVAFFTAFEEDYCWGRGAKLDPSGSQMITATQEDAKALSSFNVIEGQQIGVSFREHMLCHQNFSLRKALAENYLFLNRN